jgi:hypothetical protein
MAKIAVAQFSRKKANVTPQTVKAKESQVQNNAGGFVFQLTPLDYLRRFLILGAEGGTYYVKEQELTKQNHANVITCIQTFGKETVDMIVEISDKGLAPKNDPPSSPWPSALLTAATRPRLTPWPTSTRSAASAPTSCTSVSM